MPRRACVLGLVLALVAAVLTRPAAAQLAPAVRDRVIPAAVEVALIADVTDNGQVEHDYLPVGSGTIVSPGGLVLTNWHVVDRDANRDRIAAFEATQQAGGHALTIDLDPDRVLLLTTNSVDEPAPAYLATVVGHDAALDLAVLKVTGDDQARPLPSPPNLPFVALGDSDALRLGDPLHVFGYPGIGGDTLTYTAGVVSGFEHEPGVTGIAWIKTDATMAGGSSGGSAVNAAGELVGVPTQGTALDCRPGDTNGDGTASAADVGCVLTGGSIGEVRPINLAKPLLAQAGFVGRIAMATAVPTLPLLRPSFPVSGTATAAPTQEPTETPSDLLADPHATATAVARQATTAEPKMASYCANGPVYAPGAHVIVILFWPAVSARPEQWWVSQFYQAILDAKASVDGGPTADQLAAMSMPERKAVADRWLLEVTPTPALVPPFLMSAPNGDARPVGVLHSGVGLEITGPYVEGGACDWWPVRVIDPHGAATVQVGQEGYVLEQFLRRGG